MNIKDAISSVVEGKDLSGREIAGVMTGILKGEATPSQIASFITGLRMKGETVDEITGLVRAMRRSSLKVVLRGKRLVDTCGTGGDKKNTFNVSTAAAFVAAGAGVTVAKHGNRSVSSRCGSADVLEALGVKILLGASQVQKCLSEIGVCFLFAPVFHSAMKHAVVPRRETGIRTVFNILGPLTNPAGARGQVLGVYDRKLVDKLAKVLLKLGSKRALVVHSIDGLDEISLDRTSIAEIRDGKIRYYTLNAQSCGFRKSSVVKVKGGNIQQNARYLKGVLQGKTGPRRDIVILNSAAAIVAGGLADDIKEAVDIASESIDSGRAFGKLELLVKYSNTLSKNTGKRSVKQICPTRDGCSDE